MQNRTFVDGLYLQVVNGDSEIKEASFDLELCHFE